MAKDPTLKEGAEPKTSIWEQIDYKSFIPGAICLVAIVIAGAVAPDAFGSTLTSIHGWLMAHFKWLYILVVAVIVVLFLFILFSKYGNIRLGGQGRQAVPFEVLVVLPYHDEHHCRGHMLLRRRWAGRHVHEPA